MHIFDGKSVSQAILENLKNKIILEKVKPVLAIILVGNDEASRIYVNLKKEAGKRIGIEVQDFIFSQDSIQDEVINKIEAINNDSRVDGIIVQLPLPKKFNENEIIGKIDAKKDVDGFHTPIFIPVLPKAILFTLSQAFADDFKNKKIMALVNSEIFGQVLKEFLKKEGINLIYLINNKESKENINAKIQLADAIITVCGCLKLINENNIKKGVVLIDAGIFRDADGIVKGDVDKESVSKKASFLTPVPGGIGPLTVAFLLENVYLSALRKKNIKS
ncbi:MAG: bifunctional 5,10-methylenetetrahydrofolate dehydrogenase/5,10-methenyltetrahydrofolate cyclohydrolase [Candidatus Staskawiczbacteria bacterium]|nr:bifunctional 5,10-methylenetetrahydrofolate dehydrogenase/5,10-methenyltetrahydrofolate cyclohydrolase [Candidatus Staskawiczbacteria bacterium]